MSAKKVFVNVHMGSAALTARTQSAKTIAHSEANVFWQTRKHTVLPKQNATVKLVLKAMIAALDNAHLTATIQTKLIVASVIRGSVTANKNTLGTTAACTSASKARAEVLSLQSL